MAPETEIIPALHKERWTSIVVRCDDFWRFVYGFLIPFSMRMENSGLISSFFYKIEYYQPVVQVNVKTSQFILDKSLKAIVFELLDDYYKEEYPLNFSLNETLLELKQGYDGYDLDNFRWVGLEEYHIDQMSYVIGIKGSKVLMDLAVHSTQIMLHDFKKAGENNWTIEDSIEKGLSLHLAVLHTFIGNRDDIYQFLCWITASMIDNIRKLDNVIDMLDWKFQLLRGMQDNFDRCTEALLGYTQYILENLETQNAFEEEWLNQWIDDCCQCRERLAELKIEGNLSNKNHVDDDKSVFHAIDNETYGRWQILYSILKTVNSQLGITQNYNLEVELFYSLKQSLMVLTKSQREILKDE